MTEIQASAIGTKLLYAFAGKEQLPDGIKKAIRAGIAGVTLFRHLNVENPQQVRALTSLLQQLAAQAGQLPLLIAVDQEGGQLMAVNGTTPLPGNMALGAAQSEELSYQAGKVLALELSAMGINVNYAPSMDVNNNPDNPVIGVRSFGADPVLVGKLGGALIRGLQENGVAACAKHFPGHGDTAGDSHHMLPKVAHDRAHLDAIEFPPFLAAFQQNVQMVMTAHLTLPAIEAQPDTPATLSRTLLTELLRHEFGYQGVIITDAMDMKAIRQGPVLVIEALAAYRAGADILLLTADETDQRNVYEGILLAVQRGLLNADEINQSAERVFALRRTVQNHFIQADLSVIGCEVHMQVARRIAEQSITLLKNDAKQLPLQLQVDQRVVILLPKPVDLTPADTSSFVHLSMLDHVKAFHANAIEIQYAIQPEKNEIAQLLKLLSPSDLVIMGTINARQYVGQVKLINEILRQQGPQQVISVALRLPDDLACFEQVQTALCSYSILEPSLEAVVKILWGVQKPTGKLPVPITDLYPIGYACAI